MISDRAAQHRIRGFDRLQHRPLRDLSADVHFYLARNPRERLEMIRQLHANHHHSPVGSAKVVALDRSAKPLGERHANVCTSTERTGGRSWTMAVHVSPASAEA